MVLRILFVKGNVLCINFIILLLQSSVFYNELFHFYGDLTLLERLAIHWMYGGLSTFQRQL